MIHIKLYLVAILAFACFANCVKVDLPPMPINQNKNTGLLDVVLGLLDLLLGIKPVKHDLSDDSTLLTHELIRKYGYPVEIHRLNTSDGYVLEMHRIPGSPTSPPAEGKTVVYLQHGLFDSSATWVMMGPQQGFAYQLADLGYDVWLGNVRGNFYSRKHTKYNPDGSTDDRRRYWSFSWHEIGITDLPAMIDYISEQTGQHRMHYVGHSQGCTAFFVMASIRTEYNDRIISMNALAPGAYMSHLRGLAARPFFTFMNTGPPATNIVGIYEFLPRSDILTQFGQAACYAAAPVLSVCSNILFLMFGFDSEQLNKTMVPVILAHTPAGAATKQIIHYAQLFISGRFCQYDYGAIANTAKYGSTTPPAYNTSAITAPVALHYSENDMVVEPVDVQHLKRELGNAVRDIVIPFPKFNHLDFVWAIDARTLVYKQVISIINEFQSLE